MNKSCDYGICDECPGCNEKELMQQHELSLIRKRANQNQHQYYSMADQQAQELESRWREYDAM